MATPTPSTESNVDNDTPNTTFSDVKDSVDGSNSNGKTHSKKRRHGRSARRRKAKKRTIEDGYQLLLQGTNPDENSNTTSKGCLIRRTEMGGISDEDRKGLTQQLGYIPGNLVRVAARSPSDSPTVVQLYPLALRCSGGTKKKARLQNHGSVPQKNHELQSHPQPFPTMYWLTCPLLRASISRLENEGGVSLMEQRLQSCENSQKRMAAAHAAYGQKRWDLMVPADRETGQWRRSLGPEERGVAGIQRMQHGLTVKCLHTHAAHYLAQRSANEDDGISTNIVGKWVIDTLEAKVNETNKGSQVTMDVTSKGELENEKDPLTRNDS